MGSVEEIEYFDTELERLIFGDCYSLIECQIDRCDAGRAEGVTTNHTVLWAREGSSYCQKIYRRLARRKPDARAAVIGDDQPSSRIQPVCKISVEVYVHAAVDCVRLTRLKREDTRELKTAEEPVLRSEW